MFDDKYVGKNVVLDVIPDNMCEVASFNNSTNAYFSNLTPDSSGGTEASGYYNVYQGDGFCYNSSVDMCTYNTGNSVVHIILATQLTLIQMLVNATMLAHRVPHTLLFITLTIMSTPR